MKDVMREIEEVALLGRATRVTRVAVRLGSLSHFTPEHFRQHFADLSRGTIAEDAEVDAVLDEDITDLRAGDVVVQSVQIEIPEPATTS
jgi:hydrogenase nickel incorporation protein HypA/HybF